MDLKLGEKEYMFLTCSMLFLWEFSFNDFHLFCRFLLYRDEDLMATLHNWCVLRVRERFELGIALCFFFLQFFIYFDFLISWIDDSMLANNFHFMIMQYPSSSHTDITVYNASSNFGWLGVIDNYLVCSENGEVPWNIWKSNLVVKKLFTCSNSNGFREVPTSVKKSSAMNRAPPIK